MKGIKGARLQERTSKHTINRKAYKFSPFDCMGATSYNCDEFECAFFAKCPIWLRSDHSKVRGR